MNYKQILKAVLESAKELLRVAALAAVAAVVGYVAQKVNAFDPTSLQFIVGTAALRFVDKFIHLNDGIKAKGLLPF